MIVNFLLVGLGGAAGSVLRYAVQKNFNTAALPYGIFIVNITGCLLIGIFWGLVLKNILSENNRLLLMSGFCGGFTTFSALSIESVNMLQDNRWMAVVLYSGLSIFVGILATFIGFKLSS